MLERGNLLGTIEWNMFSQVSIAFLIGTFKEYEQRIKITNNICEGKKLKVAPCIGGIALCYQIQESFN